MLGEDTHDIGLLHDEEFVAVDLDLGAGPFAKQHLVAGFDAHGLELPIFAAGWLSRISFRRSGVGGR